MSFFFASMVVEFQNCEVHIVKVRFICLSFVLLLSSAAFCQDKVPTLKDLSAEFMLRGYFYAGSTIVDKNALGGFGGSSNVPKPIEMGDMFPSPGISLAAFPNEETPFAKEYKGFKVRLANTSDEPVSFSASDSRLYIIQEAKDGNGNWNPIEYLPSSWCGNSYHSVFLGPNQYWEFAAPKFAGSIKTKLRFRLQIVKGKSLDFVYSNEFDGFINPKQFTVEQGHKPTSIMDPYNN